MSAMDILSTQPRLQDGEHLYALRFGQFMRAQEGHYTDDGEIDWRIVGMPAANPADRRKLDTIFTSLMAQDSESSLCDEYDAWCTAHGLPQVSADEQDLDVLTHEQRSYLHSFILRWDRAVGGQQDPAGCLSYESWAFGSLSQADE